MNIRSNLIEIQCSQRDANDVAQALVHSIIFFRTHGIFNYKHDSSYSIGTLGFERAFCDHFDFTYVRCSSLALVTRINNKVQEFADRLNENTHSGIITVDFYTKRPNRWPFNDSKIVWEQWNIKLTLTPPVCNQQVLHVSPSSTPHLSPMTADQYNNSGGFQQRTKPDHSRQMRLEDVLSHKLLDIIKIINSEFSTVPTMPNEANLDTVFDTSHSDLQPYLYNISYKINELAPGSQSAIGGIATGSMGGGSASNIGGAKSNDGDTQSSIKKFLLGTLEL